MDSSAAPRTGLLLEEWVELVGPKVMPQSFGLFSAPLRTESLSPLCCLETFAAPFAVHVGVYLYVQYTMCGGPVWDSLWEFLWGLPE